MSNPYFNFKQFTVYHDKCAMKVGTDGVLLGAWTDVSNAYRILDVGTGSGLIAMMLSQRNANASIDTIEIDESATMQANDNFDRASFDNISKCKNVSLQTYSADCTEKYDLIVSNPPFFNHSLKSPDSQRSLARHTDCLFIEDFIGLSTQMLSENGRISFVFPYAEKEYLLKLGGDNGLYISRVTDVLPTPDSLPKRVLIEFSVLERDALFSTLVIETDRHIYASDFVDLVKDFYLKM